MSRVRGRVTAPRPARLTTEFRTVILWWVSSDDLPISANADHVQCLEASDWARGPDLVAIYDQNSLCYEVRQSVVDCLGGCVAQFRLEAEFDAGAPDGISGVENENNQFSHRMDRSNLVCTICITCHGRGSF